MSCSNEHRGKGPDPNRINSKNGEQYLKTNFPKLDYILSCKVKGEQVEEKQDAAAVVQDNDAKLPVPLPDSAQPNVFVSFKLAPGLGDVTLELDRKWSTSGLNRFVQLVETRFLDEARFFRVVPGFVVQFGLPADPSRKDEFGAFKDEPVVGSNSRGTISFATSGPNTRSTQLFINLGNNARLDGMGFSPFGRVVAGMELVDAINSEYGESPSQGEISQHGNEYLKKNFPNLSYIRLARLVGGEATKEDTLSQVNGVVPGKAGVITVGRSGRDSFETAFAVTMVFCAILFFYIAIRVLIGKRSSSSPTQRAKY
jgi:cyclophilin family peptidyl-prolyl cis-trans isomerase